jgi:hypothetical protein
MKIKRHKFKPSGKWYTTIEEEYNDNMSYYDVILDIKYAHEKGSFGKYGDEPWTIVCMGEGHPDGYPFISRGF